jgi:preprotein translocase subunit SecB
VIDTVTDTKQQPSEKQLEIQRIYIKDLSIETPQMPQLIRENWQPNIGIDLHVNTLPLQDHCFEVLISLSVQLKKEKENDIIFLLELQQAGIFRLFGFEGKELEHLLNVYCPSILFPYARENVASLMMKTSLPPLHLAPVNFEVLYKKKLEEEGQASSSNSNQSATGTTTIN